MTLNNLFKKSNILFTEKNYLAALEVYKNIFLRFPKNTRLFEEIKKKEKKYKQPIVETYSKVEIQEFFNLENSGNISTVIKILTNNLKKNTNDILTISLLGNFYGLNKDFKNAIHFQKQAIEKAPFESIFYLNLSETLKKNNQLEQSLSILYFAKILSPKNVLIDIELAKLNTSLKNFAKSDLIYNELIKDRKINKDIILSYCDNLIKFNKENEVISFLEKLKKGSLVDETFQYILGLAYFKKKQFGAAKNFLLKSISLNKDKSYVFTLLGDCYSAVDDLENAKINYENSLNIEPNNKMALNNLAALSFFKGNFLKAEKIYQLSLENNENNYDAMYYLAQCQLAQCNFVSGWKNFEFRWLANQFNSKKLKSNLPKFYLGTEKKNLLLWSEQGIGDQILFIRFLEDLEPFVDNLYINIDYRLHKITSRFYPKIKFFVKNDHISNINTQFPLCDLGSLFVKDTTYFFRNKRSYLTSDLDIKNNLKNTIQTSLKEKKLICGLSWISNNKDIGNSKSLSLEMLKPILLLENITFVDLQYTDTTSERNQFYKINNVNINKIEDIDNFNDLNGLTALIDICDFVITVSNTNAHISGALGKKTFLLLPKGKGRLWYWSSKDKKSIWYPSVKIVEQNVVGSWESAILELRKNLRDI